MRSIGLVLGVSFASLPIALLGACDGGTAASKRPSTVATPGEPTESVTPALSVTGDREPAAVRIVFLGDSLTAGYGLPEEQAFPALVEAELRRRGLPVVVVNAGVSGDTTAGGLRRIDWLLRQRPAVVVLGLGANDGLRGQPLAGIESNLREIVNRARAGGAQVLLLGMRMPSNYGDDYAGGFQALYRRLADELDLPFVPFLLAGVALDPQFNQADQIHPNAEGQKLLARNVLAPLEPLVRRVVAPLD
jgi:acyl-CoA thioesterase-1